MAHTLLAPRQVWVSKHNGRLCQILWRHPEFEPGDPLSRWHVRRADGATDDIEEANLYVHFDPFNAKDGFTMTLADGSLADVVPGRNAPPKMGDKAEGEPHG